MRLCSDRQGLKTIARGVVAAAGACALVACSSTPPAAKQAPAHGGIQQSNTGFTLTEEVRVSADTRSEYDNAVRLLAQKQYAQGIASLQKVTQSAPNLAAPYIDLGIAYRESGDLDKAEASLKRALELNAAHPIAYNELGMVYRHKGQFAAARASYEKALALVPDLHFARLNLAILCDLYLVDLTCALDNYLAYQQAVPDDKQATIWIADLRTRAGR
jgi:tetratricopeptide (TPR) repeat protein